MIQRACLPPLEASLRRFPVVGLVGSRQAGKTTVAKGLARKRRSGTLYLDLEKPSDESRLEDAESYLRALQGRLVILDEVQRKPSLFPLIRSLVDERPRPGRFLLLGSAQPSLLRQSAESLAGRIRYHELGPLSLEETGEDAANRLWPRGGYPGSFLARSDAASLEWRLGFIATYLERDLPKLGSRIPTPRLRRFWEMLAHSQGGIWNASRIASGLGVTFPVVQHYLDVLEETFQVRRLQPYSANVGKRLVKAPKVYLRDSGLVHALLGLGSLDKVLGHPVAGPSWEGWVLEQALAGLPETVKPFYYRTHGGTEVDLVLESGGRTVLAVEIKRTSAPSSSRGLREAMADLKIEKAFLVHAGSGSYPLGGGVEAIPVGGLSRRIAWAARS